MVVIHTIKLRFMIINASDVFIASVNSKYLLFRRIPQSLKGGRTAKKCLFKIYLKTTPLTPPCILNWFSYVSYLNSTWKFLKSSSSRVLFESFTSFCWIKEYFICHTEFNLGERICKVDFKLHCGEIKWNLRRNVSFSHVLVILRELSRLL